MNCIGRTTIVWLVASILILGGAVAIALRLNDVLLDAATTIGATGILLLFSRFVEIRRPAVHPVATLRVRRRTRKAPAFATISLSPPTQHSPL